VTNNDKNKENTTMTDIEVNDALTLFKFEEDGELQLTETGERLMNSIDQRVKEAVEPLVKKLDEYLEAEIGIRVDEAEDGISELRRLLLLAVSDIAGPDKVRELLQKVGSLARKTAVSAASSDWAQGSPGAVGATAVANRDSIQGHAREEVEHGEEDVELLRLQAKAVFEEVADGLNRTETQTLLNLSEDITFDGDTNRLREHLRAIRQVVLPNRGPINQYVATIARTVRS
jgi:hypothetical protein